MVFNNEKCPYRIFNYKAIKQKWRIIQTRKRTAVMYKMMNETKICFTATHDSLLIFGLVNTESGGVISKAQTIT